MKSKVPPRDKALAPQTPMPEKQQPRPEFNFQQIKLPEVKKPGMTTIQVFNSEWLGDTGGEWTDPATKEKHRIRVSEVIHYERQGALMNRVTLSRRGVSSYFEPFTKEAKKKGINVTESDADWGRWNDLSLSPENKKFFPFQPGPFTRQMYVYDFWMMLGQAAKLYNYNPLAHAGIVYKSAFALGTGPKVIFTGENAKDLQEKWDRWHDETKFLDRFRTWTQSFLKNGNLMLEDVINKRGDWRIKWIDPGTVYEQITEPTDIEIVYGYVLMYPTQYQVYGTGAKGEKVNLNEFIFETIPPDNILHMKRNIEENEKWGRSDLLCVLDVCEYFMHFLQARTLQAYSHAQFSWDILLKNADSGDVETMTAQLQTQEPTVMGNFVHNENVERTPQSASGGSTSARSSTFEELVTAFAIGITQPKEYLGMGDSGTRATAITASEPAMKVFVELRSQLETALRWVVRCFAKRNEVEITSKDFEVNWPELVPENATEKISNLLLGYMNKAFTHKRFSEGVAKELDVRAYDYADEQANRQQEEQAAAEQDPLMRGLYGQEPGVPKISGKAPVTPPPNGTGTPPETPRLSPGGISNQDRKDTRQQGQP